MGISSGNELKFEIMFGSNNTSASFLLGCRACLSKTPITNKEETLVISSFKVDVHIIMKPKGWKLV